MPLIKPAIIHLVDDKDKPLCRFTFKTKRAWPRGNYWMHSSASKRKLKQVNCKKCKKKI